MKLYSTYLFDSDGTLIDTTDMIYECFVYSCKRFGNFTPLRTKIEANIGIPLRPQLELLLGPLSDEKAAEVIKAHMDYQLAIYKKYLRLFPGVYEALVKLKEQGKKLGVVTSRRRESLDIYLKQTNIFDLFDVLITPESTAKHKPDPEPAFEAIKQVKALPSETLFVGDSTFDIECGNKAGIDTAFVKWSRINPASFPVKPTYIINDLTELL